MFSLRYRYIFIALLSLYSFANILFTNSDRLIADQLPNGLLFITLSVFILLIWEFNRLTEHFINRYSRLIAGKIHPLVLQFVTSLVGIILCSLFALLFITNILNTTVEWSTNDLRLLSIFGFRINLFLNAANGIYFYINKLRESELEAEQLKKINVEAQFEALRSQINPHFLFNCLNALSSLVYKDPIVSAKFISHLSNVYRYLLFYQEKKLVSLKEELDFLDAYLYLLKIRFGENIKIELEKIDDIEHFQVAPASLQMLIENAIKHNVVSQKNPLSITLKREGDSISVINNLQEKITKEASTFVGLRNIIRRYGFLTDQEVMIHKTETEFKVTLPLLTKN